MVIATRTALVLGASGSVGAALVRALMASGDFRIVSVVRTPQPEQIAAARRAGVEMREVLLPAMDAVTLEAAVRDVVNATAGEVVGLSVLGVGAKTASLTIDQHRAVDVELNAAFARGLAASARTTHLALMSAVGADAKASPGGSGAAGTSRYNRVKGEAEAAVLASGVPVVSIFRPSLIIGSQHTPWILGKALPLLSFITPDRFRPITVQQIASAMVATSRRPPAASAVYHFGEMLALGHPIERVTET